MVQYQNSDMGMMNRGTAAGRTMPYTMDWSNEVTPEQSGMFPAQNNAAVQGQGMTAGGQNMNMNNQGNMTNQTMPMVQPRPQLNMQNQVSDEVIESPLTVSEAYRGSLKSMLMQNRGNYIVATFLIGTQSTVSFEGILYEVGNDFVTIYQEGRDRYIVVDMYSLKYTEFYDTQRREMCAAMLRENGEWQTL